LSGRLNLESEPFRYKSICLAASSRTFEEPREFAFLHSSTDVIFSASAVKVMKPNGVGKDRLEIALSLMPQLLPFFDFVKAISGIGEKLHPKTQWALG
jgi:hypothetical protein